METFNHWVLTGFISILSIIFFEIIKTWTKELTPSFKDVRKHWVEYKILYTHLLLFILFYGIIVFLQFTSFIPFGKSWVFYMSSSFMICLLVLTNFKFALIERLNRGRMENARKMDEVIKDELMKTIEDSAKRDIIIFDFLAQHMEMFNEFVQSDTDKTKQTTEFYKSLTAYIEKKEEKHD